MTSQPSFQIISSLRYDPALPHVAREGAKSSFDLFQTPYYLLPYHRDRLLHAAQCFQWTKAEEFLQQNLGSFVQFLDRFIADKSKPWRLRIVVDRSGACTVDVNPTAAIDPLSLLIPLPSTSPSTVWHVYVDREPTDPSLFTIHKTTAREVYSAARLRAGIMSPQETAEVLLVNPKGEVMEGSITTVYFRRRQPCDGPAWTTPPLACGGNAGTTRRYALDQAFCTEQTVVATDLIDGEECWLSNGVRGFLKGQLVLREGRTEHRGSPDSR